MLKDMTFELSIDEETAIKDITDRYSYIATHGIPLSFFYFIKDFSWDSKIDLTISSVSFFLMILYLFLILSMKSSQAEKSYFLNTFNKKFFFKIILEIILCNKIILRAFTENLSINDYFYIFIPSFFLSLTFETNILHSIGYNIVKSLLLLTKCDEYLGTSSIFVRLIQNIFSTKIFLNFFILIWCTFLEFFVRKGMRELWALYDSFKRSYFNMKRCLLDEHPIPSIVVTNKRPNFFILYKNKEAEDLFAKTTILKPKEVQETHFKKSQIFKKDPKLFTKNTSEIINLEDIFTNEMETSFCAEVEKCIFNRKKYFDFPLKIIEKSPKWVVKQAEGKQTFFKGDLSKFEWYRVIISPCNWKNQEAIFIQLIKNDEFHANEFISTYLSNINEQINLLVENSEMVANKVIDFEFEKLKDKSISEQKYLKISVDAGVFKSGPKIPEIIQKKTPEFPNQVQTNTIIKSKITPIKKVVSVGQGLLGKSNLPSFPNYDHSLWLFFKYNINFIFDLNLTVDLFYSLINKKVYPPSDQIKVKEFINYLIDLFYVISKVKNFKFIIKNLCDDEIIVCYLYYRTILFNLLLFIVNNSNSADEKIVEITLKNERNFESKQDMYNFLFEFKYYDNKAKINYNTVREILAIENSYNFINIYKDILKIKCLDLGLVLSNYILQYVYDNNLNLLSYGGNNTISFYLKGFLLKTSLNKIPLSNVNYNVVKLKEPRPRLFEQYQTKILQKVYKLNPPVVANIDNIREKLWKLENRELKKGFTFKTDLKETDELEEKYDPKEEENQSLEKDHNLVKDINISLYKHIKEHEKLIKQKCEKNVTETIKKLKEKGDKIKFIKTKSFPKQSSVQIKWDINMTNIVRYFYPPRILIVEDTTLGRVALIGILRSYKLNVLIDIAACGYEAIQKYKFFLRKGFIYDIIFMDYNLPDMLGSEVSQIIREYELEYSINKTNICAVSVDPERVVMKDHLFDGYIEKPVRNEQFYNYITNIFGKNRPDMKWNSKSHINIE